MGAFSARANQQHPLRRRADNSVTLRPVRLEPQFVPRIWGSRNLAPLFPDKKSHDEPIGEVWLTGNDCRFVDGPFAGEKLGEVWPRMDEDWTGKHVRRDKAFPVLVKFLFPEEKLSVQVHPDDDYAMRHEAVRGGVGKTEMWYVVSARPGAEVRVSFKAEVTKESFRRAVAEGTAEELLERIAVAAGDAIFVPAGTVHTIGPGMVLCEIQQNSDITYRVHDFGRLDAADKPRELHIEKAFGVIRFGEQHGGRVSPSLRDSTRSAIVECAYFSVTKFSFSGSQQIKITPRMQLAVIVEGTGDFRMESGEPVHYAPAQAWLFPAALADCIAEARERTTLLCVSVPESEQNGVYAAG